MEKKFFFKPFVIGLIGTCVWMNLPDSSRLKPILFPILVFGAVFGVSFTKKNNNDS